ncbi:MAG: caspase domain-containing protein [bacterium]
MANKALLIGINDYKGFNDLQGCINDLKSMRKILMNYVGFQAEDIRVLTDERATKQNIVTRLQWLVRNAKKGDWCVVHFSGHGSQIRDRDDNDELSDRLDEIICPYDMDWDSHTYITDDQLYDIFRDLEEGVLLEVFLDCCHAGTGTREVSPRNLPDSTENVRYRYLPPPFDIVCRSDTYSDLKKRGFGPRSRLVELNHVLWSACKEDQAAAESLFDGRPHGAFTHCVCRHFEATLGKVSRLGLLRRIHASLRHGGFSQIPQLQVPPDLGERDSYI